MDPRNSSGSASRRVGRIMQPLEGFQGGRSNVPSGGSCRPDMQEYLKGVIYDQGNSNQSDAGSNVPVAGAQAPRINLAQESAATVEEALVNTIGQLNNSIRTIFAGGSNAQNISLSSWRANRVPGALDYYFFLDSFNKNPAGTNLEGGTLSFDLSRLNTLSNRPLANIFELELTEVIIPRIREDPNRPSIFSANEVWILIRELDFLAFRTANGTRFHFVMRVEEFGSSYLLTPLFSKFIFAVPFNNAINQLTFTFRTPFGGPVPFPEDTYFIQPLPNVVPGELGLFNVTPPLLLPSPGTPTQLSPTAPPTVAIGVGASQLRAGTYYYAYTFVTGSGGESAPSPISAPITIGAGQVVTLSAVQLGWANAADPSFVVARNIYRSLPNVPGTVYFAGQIPNALETTFDDVNWSFGRAIVAGEEVNTSNSLQFTGYIRNVSYGNTDLTTIINRSIGQLIDPVIVNPLLPTVSQVTLANTLTGSTPFANPVVPPPLSLAASIANVTAGGGVIVSGPTTFEYAIATVTAVSLTAPGAVLVVNVLAGGNWNINISGIPLVNPNLAAYFSDGSRAIYRRVGNDPFRRIGTVGPNVTTFVDNVPLSVAATAPLATTYTIQGGQMGVAPYRTVIQIRIRTMSESFTQGIVAV